MAIYLRLPPGSEGTSVPVGQPMEPTLAGPEPIEPPEGRMSLAASGLGYLNLPMAGPRALKDSGKCSPFIGFSSGLPAEMDPN